MKPPVIGLVGRRGSGKSTAAERLHLAHSYARIPFAKPLKDMLRSVGLTDAHIEGTLKELPCPLLLGATPRHAMQSLGTGWGRDMIHPDLWIHLWREQARRQRLAVAEDVRFANEAAAIRSLGGVLIRLYRAPLSVDEADTHVSETELDSIICDFTLMNDGPLEDLVFAVDRLVAA